MNCVIDIGNTRAKIAVFSKGEMLEQGAVQTSDWSTLIRAYSKTYPGIQRVLLSSVVKEIPLYDVGFSNEVEVLSLDDSLNMPFRSHYESFSRLGADRKAVLAGAIALYPGQSVLIFDLGSCLTCDLLDAEGWHRGGTISPGWGMRLRAMHKFTGRLPLVEPDLPLQGIGNSTDACMQSGAYYGMLAEIERMIEVHQADFPDLTVILTGGDASIFGKSLKNRIFAHSNLLLEGLNALLDYNT